MAKDDEAKKPPEGEQEEEKVVSVPLKLLTELQEGLTRAEKTAADATARAAGVEDMFAANAGANTIGESKLREKKTFEPAFRTVRLRKYPIAGDLTDLGFVGGWTNRGAYQEVDRTGIAPQTVDYIDVIFLNHEKTEKGAIKAEKIKLLDLLNKGEQVYCKILETKREDKPTPTGEEIDVTVFDPQHGLVSTGEKIDGYVTFSSIQYKLNVPGIGEMWVDATYCN